MTLNKDQFREWQEDYVKSRDIRVPQSRYYGLGELARDMGIHHIEDRWDQSDLIGEGVSYASNWGESTEVPIADLMAQHHINRANAREIFQSIKSKGYEKDNPITVIRSIGGGGDVIANGHHRAIAARAAGMKNIPAIVVSDEDVYRGIDRYLGFD